MEVFMKTRFIIYADTFYGYCFGITCTLFGFTETREDAEKEIEKYNLKVDKFYELFDNAINQLLISDNKEGTDYYNDNKYILSKMAKHILDNGLVLYSNHIPCKQRYYTEEDMMLILSDYFNYYNITDINERDLLFKFDLDDVDNYIYEFKNNPIMLDFYDE